MSEEKAITSRSTSRTVRWCLRITVAVQCAGVASWTSSTETPVFETLCYAWEWPEDTVAQIELASIYGLLASSVTLLVAPVVPRKGWRTAVECMILVAVAAWQCWIAFTAWYQAEGLPVGYFAWLIFPEQAVRFAAPIALTMWLVADASPLLRTMAIWLLRLSAAATFIAHGYEAWIAHPPFIDLIIGAGLRADLRIEQSSAEQLLAIVGAIDFVLSGLILFGRFRSAAFYMALWGLATASSRIVHSGMGAYFDTLIRVANAGVPFAIFLYWQLTRNPAKEQPPFETQGRATQNQE